MPPSSLPASPARAHAEPVQPRTTGRQDGDACRTELIAAVSHDLRSALTTVLGALQTIARPELAPADPDLAALFSSALAQAQKMRRLLDELGDAASPHERPLLPQDLARLIREAADDDPVAVEMPADLAPAHLSAPGLRRALAGILRGIRARGPARVAVADDHGDCRITVGAAGDDPPTVPQSTARLVAAMGGHIEETKDGDVPSLRLTFPVALQAPSG